MKKLSIIIAVFVNLCGFASGGRVDNFPKIASSGHSDGGVWEITFTKSGGYSGDNDFPESEMTSIKFKGSISQEIVNEFINRLGGENDSGENF